MYAKCFKRVIDFLLSLCALVVLSPLFLILTILGAVFMRGNPFFTQLRPGRKDSSGKERIFKLLKFRTMTNEKDASGELLPDDQRLNGYGRILRSTSLDELPELFNIIVGDMAIVGPRPLLVSYLDKYTTFQRQRHDVRPGLTGYAQVHGRNNTTWEERLNWDVKYVGEVSFVNDLRTVLDTVMVVLRRDGINNSEEEPMPDMPDFKHGEGE